MSYVELEQFLSKGEEKCFWILSLKNLAGLAVGTFAGQRLGALLWGHGVAAVVTTLTCMALGVVLTLQYHGLLVARRLVIALRFTGRRWQAPEVDGTTWLTHDTAAAPDHASAWAAQVWTRSGDDRPILETGLALPSRPSGDDPAGHTAPAASAGGPA